MWTNNGPNTTILVSVRQKFLGVEFDRSDSKINRLIFTNIFAFLSPRFTLKFMKVLLISCDILLTFSATWRIELHWYAYQYNSCIFFSRKGLFSVSEVIFLCSGNGRVLPIEYNIYSSISLPLRNRPVYDRDVFE